MQQHDSKYFAHTHTLDPWSGVKRSNMFFFSESQVMLCSILILKGKEVQTNKQAKTHPLIFRSYNEIVQLSIFFFY